MQRIFIRHFVCKTAEYLVRENTVLTEGPIFLGFVYVAKGEIVPINLLKQ